MPPHQAARAGCASRQAGISLLQSPSPLGMAPQPQPASGGSSLESSGCLSGFCAGAFDWDWDQLVSPLPGPNGCQLAGSECDGGEAACHLAATLAFLDSDPDFDLDFDLVGGEALVSPAALSWL